jgi:adenosylmethionine-8-amino-7-oxononanoate aminotransferase
MMCLSKALTGGTIPMAVTTFSQQLFDGFLSDDVNKALFHGHTFTANPTGCAAALASLDLLLSSEMQQNIVRINRKHLSFKSKIENHPRVRNVRVRGVILAFEIARDENEDYYGGFRNMLYDFFINSGIIMRPVGNTIYILPPYIIPDELLANIYEVTELAIEKIY